MTVEAIVLLNATSGGRHNDAQNRKRCETKGDLENHQKLKRSADSQNIRYIKAKRGRLQFRTTIRRKIRGRLHFVLRSHRAESYPDTLYPVIKPYHVGPRDSFVIARWRPWCLGIRMAPGGPPLVTSDQGKRREGNRRCGQHKREKKSRRTTVSQRLLRLICVKSHWNATAAFSSPSGMAPVLVDARGVYAPHVAYVTRTNCTNFLHKLLPSLLFLRTLSTARLAVRGLSARRFYHLSSTHMPCVQLL